MNIAPKGYRTLVDALDAAPAERLFVHEWHDDDQQRPVTFAEFRRLTADWSGFLKQHGAQRGDRVVFVMPQSVRLMAAFVGAMRLGAVPTILAYPSAKVESAKYTSGLRGVTANLKAPFILVDELFPNEFTVELTTVGSTKLVRCPTSIPTASRVDAIVTPAEPENVAFIQHSSGTTGLQKGVALSHGTILRQLDHLAQTLELSSNDRIYSWLPLYHDMGLIACFMLPMVCHIPMVMQAASEWVQRPETMLRLIHEHCCTLAWMPNFAFQFIPRRSVADDASRYDLSCVRALINCSEPVKTESMDEFYAAFASHGLKREALHSSYAMAENVFAVTHSPKKGPLRILADGGRFRAEHLIQEVAEGAPGGISFTSSGRLLTQNHVRIASERGETLGQDRVGEILIQSDSLFDGYYNRPDLTAEVMVDSWYRTGDLGFVHAEELFVVGRKQDLLIIGGENIYPQDVEEAVCRHDAVHDGRAVAVGLFNPALGTEELVVVAEVQEEELPRQKAQVEREIRASVLAQLGVAIRFLFLKPSMWIVKSTAGKASRGGTREKLLREHPDLAQRHSPQLKTRSE